MKDGERAWYASTVPVGRSCARFAALDITLSVAVPVEIAVESSAVHFAAGDSMPPPLVRVRDGI